MSLTPSPCPVLGQLKVKSVNGELSNQVLPLKGADWGGDVPSIGIASLKTWENNTVGGVNAIGTSPDTIAALADIVVSTDPINFELEVQRIPYGVTFPTAGQNVIGGLTYYETFEQTTNSIPVERYGVRYYLNPQPSYFSSPLVFIPQIGVNNITGDVATTIGQIAEPQPSLGAPSYTISGFAASQLVYDPRLGDDQPEVPNWAATKSLSSSQAPTPYGAFTAPYRDYPMITEVVGLYDPVGATSPARHWHVVETLYFNIRVHQKAIGIIKNGGTGTIVATSDTAGFVQPGVFTILSVGTPNTVQLDKASSRGDSVVSDWSILKDGVTAIDGVDYQLGGGQVLTDASGQGSDVIDVTFLSFGEFTINHNVEGTYSHNLSSNQSVATLTIAVLDDDFEITQDINLPNILPQITPLAGQTTLSTTPLTGVENYAIEVEGILEKSSASFEQSVFNTTLPSGPTNPTVTTIYDATTPDVTWKTKILQVANVRLKVYDSNQAVIYQTTGFGPHQFVLAEDNYQVVYEISQKPTGVFTPSTWGGLPSTI